MNKAHTFLAVVCLMFATTLTVATSKDDKKAKKTKTKKATKWGRSKEKAELARKGIAAFAKLPWTAIVKGQDVVFSVADYKDPYRSRYLKPDAGKKYIAIQVEFFILRPKDYTIHRRGVRLKGAEGGVYGPPLMGLPPSPVLKSGDVGKGEHIMGWTIFEIPKDMDAKETQVRYSMFGHKTDWVSLRNAERRHPKQKEYVKKLTATLEALEKKMK